jgi:hypothetical protein
MRHKRSQNTGVVYTLVDEVVAVVDALMWNSSRNEGEFGSSAAGGGTIEIFISMAGPPLFY